MRQTKALTAATVVVLALAAAPPHRQDIPDPRGSITLAELRDHLYFLASDELEGRMTGEEGYRIAALYAASQFRAAGLLPICDDGSGGRTYLQEVPLQRTRLGPGTSLEVRIGTTDKMLAYGEDFLIFLTGDAGADVPAGHPVFAGYGIREPGSGWDDFSGLDLEGKLVLVMLSAPTRGGSPVLPPEVHKKYEGFGGLDLKIKQIVSSGAAGLVLIPDDKLLRMWPWLRRRAEEDSLVLSGRAIKPSLSSSPVPVLVAHPETVKLLFADQPFDPLTETGTYGTYLLEKAVLDLKLDVSCEAVWSCNVVGLAQGTDASLSDEYVTLGAHLDHLGVRDGAVYNGADDNASGSTAVLEVAEAVALAPPRRPCVFILFAGEEIGGHGSSFFVGSGLLPPGSIAANVNLEMVGRYRRRRGDAVSPYVIVDDRCGELRQVVEAAAGRAGGLPFQYAPSFIGGSDHWNFYIGGVPVLCIAGCLPSNTHEDYHQPGDDVEKIDFDGMLATTRMIYEVVMELGNRPSRPRAGGVERR